MSLLENHYAHAASTITTLGAACEYGLCVVQVLGNYLPKLTEQQTHQLERNAATEAMPRLRQVGTQCMVMIWETWGGLTCF